MILNYSDLYSLKEINKNNKIGLFKGTFDLMHHDHMIFTSTEKPVPQIIIDLCNKLNVEIKVLPMQNGLYTTDIIEKCKKM